MRSNILSCQVKQYTATYSYALIKPNNKHQNMRSLKLFRSTKKLRFFHQN